MPRTKSMGRAANGNGTIRKKTVTKNGKEYTYWEARCTVGYDPGTGKADSEIHYRQDAKRGCPEAKANVPGRR